MLPGLQMFCAVNAVEMERAQKALQHRVPESSFVVSRSAAASDVRGHADVVHADAVHVSNAAAARSTELADGAEVRAVGSKLAGWSSACARSISECAASGQDRERAGRQIVSAADAPTEPSATRSFSLSLRSR
jgi:hypothetical protein